MKYFAFSMLLAFVGCGTQTAFRDTCSIPKSETNKMLTLSLNAFDQDQKGGWRSVVDTPGCELRAAHVIEDYLRVNKDNIQPDQTNPMRWHVGQMWANVGDRRRAITAFQSTIEPGNDAQNFYAEATIAFLKQDRPAFDRARSSLASTPKPQGFDEAVARFKAQYNADLPPWPLNLDVVDKLGRCFSSSYKVAYGGTC